MSILQVFFGAIIKPGPTLYRVSVSSNTVKIGWYFAAGFATLLL
jgi:hypothetical protein